MHNFDIEIERISKIEGHGNLSLKVRNGKVEDVKLKITENRRFYEQAAQNQEYGVVPQLLSRICGTCSLAHEICSIKSIENALDITPSDKTRILRELVMQGLMIRDHALHLYFFSLPDLIGKDSILDFDENNKLEHKLLHDSFDIKQAGNDLSTLVAGRAVHGVLPDIGGFLSFPEKEKTKLVVKKLKGVRQQVIDIIDVFVSWSKKFERETEFASLIDEDFKFSEGEVLIAGKIVPKSEYLKHLNEFVIPYSTSRGYKFEGKVYMVGALPRINQNKRALHNDTKKDVNLKMFPSQNVFHNNLAQAIEILHCLDSAVETLESQEFKKEDIVEAKKINGEGVGIVEAPRGILYHYVKIENGNVVKSKVIVPTSQNQIKIERDIGLMIETLLPKKTKEEIEWSIEQLIRAYDPCMSCAAHFLKAKWI